jgi:Nucleotidyltransferase domain
METLLSNEEASAYLLALAKHNAQVYVSRCEPAAILLTGSVAEGLADCYSDIDMLVYYEHALPSAQELEAVRNEIGAEGFIESYSRVEGGACSENYRVRGVECQVGHRVVADLEQRSLALLDGREPGSLQHKALMGILYGVPLHGDDLIRDWQARIGHFSDRMARGMVELYLKQIFPLWYVADALARRDATAWVHQTIAETALNLVGIVAGINRRYYVPFQFKRARRFLGALQIAPDNLADRLDGLFVADTASAIAQIEELVQDTIALVNRYMPDVDTSIVRHQPGDRQRPWRAEPPREEN